MLRRWRLPVLALPYPARELPPDPMFKTALPRGNGAFPPFLPTTKQKGQGSGQGSAPGWSGWSGVKLFLCLERVVSEDI
jgi:hypothetical protein